MKIEKVVPMNNETCAAEQQKIPGEWDCNSGGGGGRDGVEKPAPSRITMADRRTKDEEQFTIMIVLIFG